MIEIEWADGTSARWAGIDESQLDLVAVAIESVIGPPDTVKA